MPGGKERERGGGGGWMGEGGRGVDGGVEYKCCINGNDRLIKDRMSLREICKEQNCQYLKPDGFYMKVTVGCYMFSHF